MEVFARKPGDGRKPSGMHHLGRSAPAKGRHQRTCAMGTGAAADLALVEAPSNKSGPTMKTLGGGGGMERRSCGGAFPVMAWRHGVKD